MVEKNWERTLPFINIDDNAINRLFKGVISKEDISDVSIIKEGCRTSNYIVKTITENPKYLLKIYYPKDQNSKRDYSIFNLIKDDIPLQKVYKISKDSCIDDREYAIYEYKDGQTISGHLRKGKLISNDIVKSAANILGKLHNYKFDKIGFLDSNLNIKYSMPPLTTWYEKAMGENAQRRLGQEIIDKIKKVVLLNKDKLLELDKEPRLVHGDFQGTNILIKDNKISGVIDWEFAMAGHPLADIGQFFRYEQYFNSESIRVFEEEYRKTSNYKLVDDWFKLSKLRDLISLLQLIDQSEEMPIKQKEIQSIIEDIIRNN